MTSSILSDDEGHSDSHTAIRSTDEASSGTSSHPSRMDGKAILSNELMYEETKPFIVSNLAEDLVFRRASTGGIQFSIKWLGGVNICLP
jgi:hypothetical protein